MQNNRVLLQRLICLPLLVLLFHKSTAQIIYTDIPDATPSASYSLDLNNDLTSDFLLQFQSAFQILCLPQNNNAYLGNAIGNAYLPFALSPSIPICNSSATWYDSAFPGTMASGTSLGYWVGETDKFLALKLIAGTDTFYGWARLDVTANSTSFTLKDYAYESTPNACIDAGQITSTLSEGSIQHNFSVNPNPFRTSAAIEIYGSSTNASVCMINSFGQEVRRLERILEKRIILDRNELPRGFYYILLNEGNKTIATKKIIITD